MRRQIRSSFAVRLLVAGVGLALTLVVGISSLLLISASQQAQEAAVTTAANRATVVDRLLGRITGPAIDGEATGIAGLLSAEAANGQDLGPEIRTLFGLGAGPFGEYPVVVGADFRAVSPAGLPPLLTAASPAVRRALAGDANPHGVEVATGGDIYATGAPIRKGTAVVGALVYIQPLSGELARFAAVVGYPTDEIAAARPQMLTRLTGDAGSGSRATTPAAIAADVTRHRDAVAAVYDVPRTGAVAGSFVPLRDATRAVVGYIGVEVPLAQFTGDVRAVEITVALLGILAILGTAIGVFVFVERFVRRPVNRLERGVARIAGGDYSTDIPITSSDELGRLAEGVNRMRAEIAQYITQIEQARARLDGAVDELGGVSRALTTTTRGVAGLQEAVVGAAAAIVGHGSAALLLLREGDHLALRATHGVEGHPPDLDGWGVMGRLLEGRGVRVDRAPAGWQAGGMLAVPMFYQDAVVGALAVITRAGEPPVEGQEQSLAVLANNAAIALENTRLFEQERETVRRLRELDALKSDFLGTVQHELRTPLTAIMGMSDLLEMCWETWDDAHKTGALHDIQVAAKKLYDIVETILDFSLLESDTLSLKPLPTQVRSAVEEAVTAVQARLKDGLQVSLSVDVPPDVEVFADPTRFNQALRALLDNAVKFTPDGGRVWVRSHRNGNGMVRIEVADTGIGIPEDALPRVFERFYQVDNTATRTYGGTGMGLALVRRLVEAHGGSVEVESRVG
ncbi:MAG TPA: ATP-binding protein, partial [Candidatus Dormibacteraeota bacterium]|nr:ATP-binding protein [Candidatus Dormibacteraeota bacterium]